MLRILIDRAHLNTILGISAVTVFHNILHRISAYSQGVPVKNELKSAVEIGTAGDKLVPSAMSLFPVRSP